MIAVMESDRRATKNVTMKIEQFLYETLSELLTQMFYSVIFFRFSDVSSDCNR